MLYELWDVESGNRIKSLGSESEALELVRKLLELNGPDYLNDLALGAVPTQGDDEATELPPVLEGPSLLARVGLVSAVRGSAATTVAKHAEAAAAEDTPTERSI